MNRTEVPISIHMDRRILGAVVWVILLTRKLRPGRALIPMAVPELWTENTDKLMYLPL
jgi:hypothetical protein